MQTSKPSRHRRPPPQPHHGRVQPASAVPATPAAPARSAYDDGAKNAVLTDSGIPDLLSSAEVEAIFDRSDRTIRDWVAKGHLRKLKVGHSVFFLADDVRRLVSSGLTEAILVRAGKPRRKRRAPRDRPPDPDGPVLGFKP